MCKYTPATVGTEAISSDYLFLVLIFPTRVSSFSSYLKSFVENVRGLYERRQIKWIVKGNAMTQGTSELARFISAAGSPFMSNCLFLLRLLNLLRVKRNGLSPNAVFRTCCPSHASSMLAHTSSPRSQLWVFIHCDTERQRCWLTAISRVCVCRITWLHGSACCYRSRRVVGYSVPAATKGQRVT